MAHKTDDHLLIQKIAGGSVIEFPPLFSPNSEILFVISNNVVRAYGTTTGEWIRDLDEAKSKIVSIQYHPQSPKLIYGCSDRGEVISWKWKSGVVNKIINLKFEAAAVVNSFNFIVLKHEPAFCFVTWRSDPNAVTQLGLFNLETGELDNAKQTLSLAFFANPIVDVSKSTLNFIAIVESYNLCVLDYTNGRKKLWRNANKRHLTCVACHPQEELIATGDETGKIFLWRKIFANCQPMTTLYHWHHTTVNSIAFTESGTNFYSGGNENVLVRWAIQNPNSQDFLPRMFASPVHIVVSNDNKKISVSASDNGIQILNSLLKPISIIQNFTWVPEDKTGVEKFPIGLKLNPRTASLVLNGRIGHLQFFSTHTRMLLFNLDTTIQNRLSVETEKVLYNISVTHAALNMDWLVTAEFLDDRQYTPESRLKFWNFDLEKQSYKLNTQIELAHEDGVTALEFSTPYSNKNLLCASSGMDNKVKIWSLNDAQSIYKIERAWICCGTTKYKNLPVRSVSFSSDGSLLAVGFGNSLAIYIPETLYLKCVLSAPAALDGSANKIILNLPPPKESGCTKETINEKHKQVLRKFKTFFESNEKAFINEIARENVNSDKEQLSDDTKLSFKEQELLAKALLRLKELNFYQKMKLFQRLALHAKGSQRVQSTFKKYIKKKNLAENLNDSDLISRISLLSQAIKFRAKRKQFSFKNRKINNAERSINSLFRFYSNDNDTSEMSTKYEGNDEIKLNINRTKTSIKISPQIQNLSFGYGEFSHLVIVCTDHRILIWNLLTLRLQTTIKLSAYKMVVDPYTNLIAAFTKTNELYVFLPNSPFLLFQRKDMPPIHGAVWIPRRYPKSNSLSIDWQATSQLYFLSKQQELLQLVADSDLDTISPNTACITESLQPLPYTPFGTMIAKQIQNYAALKHSKQETFKTELIGVLGNGNVKEMTNLQSHTMPPVNFLCKEFLKSLLAEIGTETTAAVEKNVENDMSDNDAEKSDDSDSTDSESIENKKQSIIKLMNAYEKIRAIIPSAHDRLNKENKLMRLINLNIQF